MVQIYQGTSVTLSTTVESEFVRYHQSALSLTHIILETVAWTIGVSFILKLQADFELFKATTYNTSKSPGLTVFTSPQLIHSVSLELSYSS